jgi:hypothetical protein
MAVLIILAVFSVPLAAILSSTYIKAKRLDSEGGAAMKKQLAALTEEHAELKKRVEVLEEIATSEQATDLAQARAKVEELHELEMAARRS